MRLDSRVVGATLAAILGCAALVGLIAWGAVLVAALVSPRDFAGVNVREIVLYALVGLALPGVTMLAGSILMAVGRRIGRYVMLVGTAWMMAGTIWALMFGFALPITAVAMVVMLVTIGVLVGVSR